MKRNTDMIGKRFGRWLVLARALSKSYPGGTRAFWRCRCECGNEGEVQGHALRRGGSLSCGCIQREAVTADLAGKRFGRWLVIGVTAERGANECVRWTCRCDCGAWRIVNGKELRSGRSRSCGCGRIPDTLSVRPNTIAVRKWVARNRELERARARMKSSQRRALVAAGFTGDELRERYDEQCGLCAYCLDPLAGKFEADHVIPLSRGGDNTIDNIVCACARCNRAKGNKRIAEFLSRRAA